MTPKMTALRNTLAVVAGGVGGAVLIALAFTYLTVPQICLGFAILVMIGLAKLVYEQELEKAKRLQELNNPKD